MMINLRRILNNGENTIRTDPVVDPHPGENVSPSYRPESEPLRGKVEDIADGGNAQVGGEDPPKLMLAEQRARGDIVAVIPPAPGLPGRAAGPGRDVGQEVPGPADELLEDDAQQDDGGRILDEVVHVQVGAGADAPPQELAVLGLGRRHVVEVGRHVVGELVVAGVAGPPREVRQHEGRVHGEADRVRDEGLARRERAVPALVREDPEPGEGHAGEERVRAVADQEPSPGVVGGGEARFQGEGGGEER